MAHKAYGIRKATFIERLPTISGLRATDGLRGQALQNRVRMTTCS